MYRRLIGPAAVVALVCVLCPAVPAAEQLPPAARWIPANSVVSFEITNPKALLDMVLQPKAIETITALPAYRKLSAKKDFRQARQLVGFLETMFETDWKSGLKTLTGGGVTLAVYPKNNVLLMIESEDARMLERLHEVFLGIARDEAEKQGKPGKVISADYRGVTGWSFNGKEAHAIIGRRLVIANRVEALKMVLDLRADKTAQTLADVPGYRAARKAAGPDTLAVATVNLGLLKLHPPFAKALKQDTNPLVALLFAGVIESINEADWLSLGLEAKGQTLTIAAMLDDKPGEPTDKTAFALPSKPGDGAAPNVDVPRKIAGLSLYRDLHAFYAAKDDLFPERTSGLIFFENMMGIFFSGRDLTDEVLGATTPRVRAVVAQQEYDPEIGTPRIQVPAFAAVFQLHEPEKFAVVAEEAWQKAIGLVNFTRGQKALPGLIIDRSTHGGTKFSVAYFSSADEQDKTTLPVHYNFRPSLAVVGDSLIFSSTDGLTKDLIDSLGKEKSKPVAQTDSILDLDGTRLASTLAANRDNLVRQNMVEKGNTQLEAETEINLLLTIIEHLGRAKLDIARLDGHTRASLQLKLNLWD